MNIIDFRSLRINPKSQFYISQLNLFKCEPFKGKHKAFWKRLAYEIGKSSLKDSLQELTLDGWKIDEEYIREMIFEYNLYDLRVKIISEDGRREDFIY